MVAERPALDVLLRRLHALHERDRAWRSLELRVALDAIVRDAIQRFKAAKR